MDKKVAYLLLISLLFLSAIACGSSGASPTIDEAALKQTEMAAYVQQTVIALQIQTEVAKSLQGENVPSNTPTFTPTFTPENTSTPAPSNTPEIPYLSVTLDTNCRSGPGNEYDRLGFLFTGDKAPVIGWDGVGDYYMIKNPQGGKDCWVWANYAVIEGSTSNLAVMQIPPTPTPNRLWEHTWKMKFEGETYTVRISQSGNNISGTIELEDGKELKFSGEAYADQSRVKGTYKISSSKKGTFKWLIDDDNLRFRGESVNEKDQVYAWCGAWDGQPLPAPCELP